MARPENCGSCTHIDSESGHCRAHPPVWKTYKPKDGYGGEYEYSGWEYPTVGPDHPACGEYEVTE